MEKRLAEPAMKKVLDEAAAALLGQGGAGRRRRRHAGGRRPDGRRRRGRPGGAREGEPEEARRGRREGPEDARPLRRGDRGREARPKGRMMPRLPSFARLLSALERLPGVGPKSARRLAHYLLAAPGPEAEELSTGARGGAGADASLLRLPRPDRGGPLRRLLRPGAGPPRSSPSSRSRPTWRCWRRRTSSGAATTSSAERSPRSAASGRTSSTSRTSSPAWRRARGRRRWRRSSWPRIRTSRGSRRRSTWPGA